MGAHVKSVSNQRNRSKQPTADNFGDHHRAAEPDHRPGLAFPVLAVTSKRTLAVSTRKGRAAGIAHGYPRSPVLVWPNDAEQVGGASASPRVFSMRGRHSAIAGANVEKLGRQSIHRTSLR